MLIMSSKRQRTLRPHRNGAAAWLYLLPSLVVITVFLIYPLFKVLRMGFYQKYVFITDTGSGFGLDALAYVLSDPVYQQYLFYYFCGSPYYGGTSTWNRSHD